MAANTYAQVPAVVSGSNVTSIARAFSSSCVSGNLIVAACTGEKFATTHTVTDGANAGNYAQDVEVNTTSDANSGNGRATINSITNASATALTVTCTYSVASHGRMQIYEINNGAGTPTLDSTGEHFESNGSTTPLSTSITTVAANCTVIACATHFDNSGVTNDTGYTSRVAASAGSQSYHSIEDDVDAGAAGAKTLTFGSTGNKTHAMVIAAYAPPAGGGGATLRRYTLTTLGVG